MREFLAILILFGFLVLFGAAESARQASHPTKEKMSDSQNSDANVFNLPVLTGNGTTDTMIWGHILQNH